MNGAAKHLVEIAESYIGYPAMQYRPGEHSPDIGNTTDAFDCSGFVQYCLLEAGVRIPLREDGSRVLRFTEELFDCLGVLVHKEYRDAGDLVCLTRNGVRPTHIGIYAGDGEMIHSPGLDRKSVERVSLEEYIARNPVRYHTQRSWGNRLYKGAIVGYKRVIYPREARFHMHVGPEAIC